MEFVGHIAIGWNTKLGPGVGSLNRPRKITCPGRSRWCQEKCYGRKGTFRLQSSKYNSPLKMPRAIPMLFRFHSVGDFDSKEYIEWCTSLVRKNANKRFWAYTKSWRVPKLLKPLKRLNKEPNMQLFASMDPSIGEEPPSDFRVAWIETDSRKRGVFCYHDAGLVKNCLECGYCWNEKSGDVFFKVK